MAYGRKSGQATVRQVEALSLRRTGLSYSKVGERLKITEQGAYQLVSRGLKAMATELSSEIVQLERIRLDDLLAAIWTRVERGDLDAIDRVLKIAERRAKLEGIDKQRDAAMMVMPVDTPDVSKLTADEMHTYFALMAKAARNDSDRERYEAAAAAIDEGGP